MSWKSSTEASGSRRHEGARRAGRWTARRAPAGLLLLLFSGALAVLLSAVPAAQAKVFASQKQALAEAFPDATKIERKTFVLRREQSDRIAERLGRSAEAKVVVLHVAYQGEQVIGFAEIAVHKVRTQPEALLLVLTPDGRNRSVRVIAFHEPLDYMPTERWYAQFLGKSRSKGKGDGLTLGRDIHGVVGATLSAQAAADAVRRVLAYWEVLLLPVYPSAAASTAGPAYGPDEAP